MLQLDGASASRTNGSVAASGNGSASQNINTNGASSPKSEGQEETSFDRNGGYQGVDAHNDLEGSDWQESSSVDADVVRKSKDLARKNERIADRSRKETSQSVK